MKTLNEQIERVRELLRKCYGVVANKNGEVPEVGERNMENLPNAIESVPNINYKKFFNSFIDTARIQYDYKFRSYNTNDVIDISGCKFRVSTVKYMFSGCTSPYINMENCDTTLLKDMSYFALGHNGGKFNFVGCDFSNLTSVARAFEAVDYIGYYTEENVVSGKITTFNGIKVSFTIGYNIYNLMNYANALAMASGVADLSEQTAKSVTIKYHSLTEEQLSTIRSILTAKNWTLVV